MAEGEKEQHSGQGVSLLNLANIGANSCLCF